MLNLEARRPTVSNPALQKRRAIMLQRVTMRPNARAPVAAKAAWRAPSVMAPVAAAAILAVVPLAHAGAPGPGGSMDAGPAIEVALAPEPLEVAPRFALPGPSAPEAGFMHKLEGLKPNPYDQADAPRIAGRPTARPRIVRKAARVQAADAGPMKVSDLKANPYD